MTREALPVDDVAEPANRSEPPDGPDVTVAEGEPGSWHFALPGPAAVVAWILFTAVAAAIDGWTGLFVGLTVAAVTLAGFGGRVIGGMGVGCLALVPVAVVARGPVSAADITPALVFDNMVAHHLAFAGMALLTVSVVLQEKQLLSVGEETTVPPGGSDVSQPVSSGPLGDVGPVLRWFVFVPAAVAALAVCMVALT